MAKFSHRPKKSRYVRKKHAYKVLFVLNVIIFLSCDFRPECVFVFVLSVATSNVIRNTVGYAVLAKNNNSQNHKYTQIDLVAQTKEKKIENNTINSHANNYSIYMRTSIIGFMVRL